VAAETAAMKRFTELVYALDATTKSERKLRALESYFRAAPARDAAWALYVLTGGKLSRLANGTELRTWVSAESDLPAWLVEECYASVGDLAETLALLVPAKSGGAASQLGLADLIEQRLAPLRGRTEDERREALTQLWREFDAPSRFVLNKLLTGNFRVGARANAVLRALARAAEIDDDVLARRFHGGFEPLEASSRASSTEGMPSPTAPTLPVLPGASRRRRRRRTGMGRSRRLAGEVEVGRHPRAARREGRRVLVWTRGEELVTHRFPEVAQLGAQLPDGVALDGEIWPWSGEGPTLRRAAEADRAREIRRRSSCATFPSRSSRTTCSSTRGR
jgi:DNA ligase-1